MQSYTEVIYEIIKDETYGFSSIYEDFIIQMVGSYGLTTLKRYGLIETCGVIRGRQMYVLCETIRKWRKTDVPKESAPIFEKYLQERGIQYKSRERAEDFLYECYMTDAELRSANHETDALFCWL